MIATSQMHGKVFENLIKSSGGRYKHSSADKARSPTEFFDIDGEANVCNGMPTAIKTSKSASIALSDARNFWLSFEKTPYIMVVGFYKQIEKTKQFHNVTEFVVKREHQKDYLGDLSHGEVVSIHDKLQSFPGGKDGQLAAQAYYAGIKEEVASRGGLVKLNPKVDSKNQRRLQCSVSLLNLVEKIGAKGLGLVEHTSQFGNLVLPISIVSTKRKFSEK